MLSRPLAADVIAARDGDALAFARLVREHGAMVTALATAIVGSPGAGEEVAQEVFVQAWLGLARLKTPEAFVAWLKQTTRNRARDALRRKHRRREVQDEPALASLPDPGAEAGDQLDALRAERTLWEAFAALEESDREVLALFYRQDGSVKVVAEQLELEEAAVRKRLSRARERLRNDVTEALLGRALARTAPSAAFVVAVLAALVPRSARAAGRRSTLPAWAAAGALGLAALVAGGVVRSETRPVGPAPSETRSGRAALGQRSTPLRQVVSGEVTEEASTEPVGVTVRLGTWEADGAGGLSLAFSPEDFWPALDEAPFPDGPGVRALLEHVTAGEDPEDLSDELLAALDGLRAEADSPWAALVALEAERMAAHHAFEEATAAFHERYGLPDPEEVGWEAYWSARDGVEEEGPRLDLLPVLERAADLRERWPDHPVADYADLYVLASLSDDETDTWDPEALGAEAMDVLRRADDPLVVAAALNELATTGADAGLSLDDLDLISDVFPAPSAWGPQRGLAELAVQTSLRLGAPQHAAAWMERYDRSVEDECAVVAARAATSPVGSALLGACHGAREVRDAGSSWLAALGVAEAVSWQAALGAVARRCHADHGLREPLVGEGSFDGAWTWTSWTGDTAASACIAGASVEGPTPPVGTVVRLEVLPAR